MFILKQCCCALLILLMVFTVNTLAEDSHNLTYRVSRILYGSSISDIALSPDGKILVSGNSDGDICLWDVETGRKRNTLTSSPGWGSINQSVFSPDGKMFATSRDDGKISLWDVNTGELKEWFRDHTAPISCLAFTPDGHTLASGSQDNTIRLWNVGKIPLFNRELNEFAQPITLTNHSGTVTDLVFTRNGRVLASASDDGTICVWDVYKTRVVDGRNGQLNDARTVIRNQILSHGSGVKRGVRCIAFHPNGFTLISGGIDGAIRIWMKNSKTFKRTLTGHTDQVWNIVISPDGYTLASCSFDKTVRLWDIKTSTLKYTLKGHKDIVSCIAFTPEGQTLASAGNDRTICLWNVETGTHYATLTGHRSSINNLIFSNNEGLLVSQSVDGVIRLWERKDLN